MKSASQYQEFQPANRLAWGVECFWALTVFDKQHHQLVLPDGCIDLLVRLDGRSCTVEIVETMTQAKVVKIPRGQIYMGVRCKPGMAAVLLPLDERVATNRILPLRAKNHAQFANQLSVAKTMEERVSVLERFLNTRCEITPPQAALNALAENHGNKSLEELCDLAHLGERQFRRFCVQRTGVSPKFLANILRFKKIWRDLQNGVQVNFCTLALNAGYCDQSHMNRDFKILAGVTPSDLVTRFN